MSNRTYTLSFRIHTHYTPVGESSMQTVPPFLLSLSKPKGAKTHKPSKKIIKDLSYQCTSLSGFVWKRWIYPQHPAIKSPGKSMTSRFRGAPMTKPLPQHRGLASLDLRDATATDPKDQAMIQSLVEQMPGGFHATNGFVRKSIRVSCRDVVRCFGEAVWMGLEGWGCLGERKNTFWYILNIREKHCLLTLESLFDDLGGAGRFGNERSIHWICWISLQYPCCGSIGQPRIA